MGGQEDLVASLKAIMAAKREELGAAPTPEELLEYRDGGLDPEARQRLEARIAVFPDAARALADLAAFPDVEPAPGTPELSEAEIGERWQAFRQRLAELPEPRATARVAPANPSAAGPRRSRRWPSFMAIAASLLIALVAVWVDGYVRGRRAHDLSPSAVNVTIAELAPMETGGERSAPGRVSFPESSEELVLVLGAPEKDDFPLYEVVVRDRDGRAVWSRQGLSPTPLGTFHLAFRRGLLKADRYRIELFGRDGERRTRLATYELRLAGAPGAR